MKEQPTDILGLMTHLVIPLHLGYRDKKEYSHVCEVLELTVNFSGDDDRASIDIDGVAEEPLKRWGRLWEFVDPDAFRQLAAFLDWMNEKTYFLEACQRLCKELDGYVIHRCEGGRHM